MKKWSSSLGEDEETEMCRNEPVAELLCGKRRRDTCMGTAGDTGLPSV